LVSQYQQDIKEALNNKLWNCPIDDKFHEGIKELKEQAEATKLFIGYLDRLIQDGSAAQAWIDAGGKPPTGTF